MNKLKMNKVVNVEIDSKLKITSFGGYFNILKMMNHLNICEMLSRGLGIKSRIRDYTEGDYLHSVIANLSTGGLVISDIDRFQEDKVFQEIAGFDNGVPLSNAVIKYFKKADEESIKKMEQINLVAIKRILKKVKNGRKPALRVFSFIDSSELEVDGKKIEGAAKNYNGDIALRYHAIFLEDFLIYSKIFSPEGHYVTYGWQDLMQALIEVQNIVESEIHLLMDSAYYDYSIINFIESQGWKYTISMDKFDCLIEEARVLSEQSWENDYNSFPYYSETDKRFHRVIIKRKEREPDLFGKYDYSFVITNNEDESAERLYKRHSLKMGMENHFKDLLIDLNLHHPRFLKLESNQLYYQIAMLVHNLLKAIQYLKLVGEDFFLCIRRLIIRYILIGGRLVKHAGRRVLKLPYYPGGEERLKHMWS